LASSEARCPARKRSSVSFSDSGPVCSAVIGG
jgi:hypothetical protein